LNVGPSTLDSSSGLGRCVDDGPVEPQTKLARLFSPGVKEGFLAVLAGGNGLRMGTTKCVKRPIDGGGDELGSDHWKESF